MILNKIKIPNTLEESPLVRTFVDYLEAKKEGRQIPVKLKT